MKPSSCTRTVAAGLAALGLLAAACGGSPETDPDPQASTPGMTGSEVDPANYCEGGVERDLIWAHEQEPPDMHLDDPNNNLSITSWITQALFEGLYGNTADVEHFPELLAEEAAAADNDDGSWTVSFRLRDGLVWSDGEPLTAEDVKFTHDVIMEGVDPATGEGGVYLIGDRTGYDLVTDFTVTSDTEFSITFSEPFAGFRDMYNRVFPSHVFGDGGATAVNAALPDFATPDGTPLPTSGPMMFDEWEKGVSMHLVRNDDYHGSTSPDVTNPGAACVTGVQINWVADTDAQINALKSGEADVIFTQPQVAFGDRLASDPDFTIASRPGPIFEHWGFNLHDEHLGDPLVREAIAYALDKSQVMTALYSKIFGDVLPADGLGNTYWMTNQAPYLNHQAEYDGAKVDEAKAKLEEAGYAAGADGVYEHPARGRLTLRVGTTGGNALRELQQQIIQEQLKAAGIEITIDNVPGGAYFSERPFAEAALECATSGGTSGDCDVWDITQFAWVGGPWPGGQVAANRSGSGNNPYGYANPDFDAKADECQQTSDIEAQGECYNELDRYVTTLELDAEDGLFMIPLTQKPDFYAYSNIRLSRAAIAPDTNNAGPIVNVVDFVTAS